MYLYGSNAVTNFGLQECLQDTTEVSNFIFQAKANAPHKPHVLQMANQRLVRLAAQQQRQLQQQAFWVPEAALVGSPVARPAASQSLVPSHMFAAQPTQQQQQLLPVNSQQQLLMNIRTPPPACIAYGAAAATHSLLQQQLAVGSSGQQPMLPRNAMPHGMVSTPLSATVSNVSCMLSSRDSLPSSVGGYVVDSMASGMSDALLGTSLSMSAVSSCSNELLLSLQQQNLQQNMLQAQLRASAADAAGTLSLPASPPMLQYQLQQGVQLSHTASNSTIKPSSVPESAARLQYQLQQLCLALPFIARAGAAGAGGIYGFKDCCSAGNSTVLQQRPAAV